MNKSKKYPASGLWDILIFILLLIIGSITIILKTHTFCYEFYINDQFIGYYNSYQEFENTYNKIDTERQVDGVLTTFYLDSEPTGPLKMVKNKKIRSTNNMLLIDQQLKKDYTIYKIIVNDETQFYTKTEEEANIIVAKIKEQVKESTNIQIQSFITEDLSLIETEEQREEKEKTIIEKNKKEVITSRASVPRTQKSNTTYIWPVASRQITSPFGQRSRGFHTGLDIGISSNSSVRAVMDGTVILSQWNGNYGYQVKIKHSNGIITTYAHNNTLLVSVGQTVEQGQEIAKSGSTGNSTGPHCHIEFIVNGQFQNPLNYLE